MGPAAARAIEVRVVMAIMLCSVSAACKRASRESRWINKQGNQGGNEARRGMGTSAEASPADSAQAQTRRKSADAWKKERNICSLE